MNPALIDDKLSTRIIGRDILYLAETDSTNFHAGRLFRKNELKHGMVIIADRQTAGRGRLERSWYSEGCLTMTVILEMKPQTAGLSAITLTAGAALALGLTELSGKPFNVKYPNDIMYEGKKIGGILSELKINEESFILLGIGVNVEQEAFPEDIAAIAVSLRQVGTAVSKEEVAAALLNRLEPMVNLFMEGGFPRVRPFWVDVNCTLGKTLAVSQPSGIVRGKAINIDDEGALVLETADGVQKVLSGDFTITDE